MPKGRQTPPPTTRIVEPEREHVHAPITRIDGSPAFGPAPSAGKPEPPAREVEPESTADKKSSAKKGG